MVYVNSEMMKKLNVSIVTPTLNNEADIVPFLKSLTRQTFSKSRMEILIMDGGSHDQTVSLAKKHGAKVINNPFIFADPGVDLGIQKAQGDLVMILATDNIYKKSDAIEKMVSVFENPKIMAAFPKQDSSSSDSIFSKYINTFTDPFNHFIYGYAANPRTFKKIYKTLTHNKIYDVYDFSSNPIRPLIAFAQGFTIRSGFHRKKKDAFDDLAPVIGLIQKHEEIAYVHSVPMYHHTIRGLSHFMIKQMWRTRNYLEKRNFGISHRVEYLSPWQKVKIKLWPLYSFSIILPMVRAGYGLVNDQEIMWIYHPYLCFMSSISSLASAVQFYTKHERVKPNG